MSACGSGSMVIDFANQIADAGQFSNKEFATTV